MNIDFFLRKTFKILFFLPSFNMRRFTVTGLCVPDQDYMVDISNKVSQIMVMVERGDYFTINRARQYGKTTTLWQLDHELVRQGYTVAHISFEGIGDEPFENARSFCESLLRQIARELKSRKIKGYSVWEKQNVKTFEELDIFLGTYIHNLHPSPNSKFIYSKTLHAIK